MKRWTFRFQYSMEYSKSLNKKISWTKNEQSHKHTGGVTNGEKITFIKNMMIFFFHEMVPLCDSRYANETDKY